LGKSVDAIPCCTDIYDLGTARAIFDLLISAPTISELFRRYLIREIAPRLLHSVNIARTEAVDNFSVPAIIKFADFDWVNNWSRKTEVLTLYDFQERYNLNGIIEASHTFNIASTREGEKPC
jgi:hypothetical protein